MVKYKICYNFANVQGCIGCGFYYNSLHRKPMPIIKSGSIKKKMKAQAFFYFIFAYQSHEEKEMSLY